MPRICDDCGIPRWMDCVCGGEKHITALHARAGYAPATIAMSGDRDDEPEGPMLPPNHDPDEPF